MGTGGTIPKKITQTVTFYNTTGVIEKDKLIYLAPRFKNVTGALGKQVRNAYISALEGMCPPSSAFKDYPISSWSPQDRTLSVRANIDDFRLVTDEGECLNYLIVTRTVVKTINNVDKSETFYYGFFITDVGQTGGVTVDLTLEPDDFTNVFYLHNRTVLNTDLLLNTYEPFNERMKNCYVKRQHYNRVDITNVYYEMSVTLRDIHQNPQCVEGQQVTLQFADHDSTVVSGEVLYFDDQRFEDDNIIIIKVKVNQKYNVGEPDNYSILVYDNVQYSFDYNADDIIYTKKVTYIPANRDIFLNQEETYRYKYQYKDYRLPMVFNGEAMNFTKDELNTIVNSSPASISDDLKKKYAMACIKWLVIQFKSSDVFAPIMTVRDVEGTTYRYGNYYKGGSSLDENMSIATPVLYIPFVDVPSLFKGTSMLVPDLKIRITSEEFINVNPMTKDISAKDNYHRILEKMFNSSVYGNYIFSAYISQLPPRDFDYEYSATGVGGRLPNITIKTGIPTLAESGILDYSKYHQILYNCNPALAQFVAVPVTEYPDIIGTDWSTKNTSGTEKDKCLVFDMINHTVSNDNLIGLCPIDYLFGTKKLTIEDKDIPNLKSNYYENVLEAEPYSFVSISCLSNETPLQKVRYYEGLTSVVDYKINTFVNGLLKQCLIPYYTVEGKKALYYNESMSIVLQNPVTFVSDAYETYYYQNMSQMKNQFAVNDYQRGTDLLQRFFVTGPNAVGQSAFKHGWIGAVSETVNQVAGMIDDAIDWAQSKHVIEMNQKAKLADVGRSPDVVKQSGSEIYSDVLSGEYEFFLNHYTIDSLSYNSIAKLLERTGYQVNLFTSINALNRVGWNYVQVNSFDFNPAYDIMNSQEDNLRKLFSQGITLLHDKSFLTSGHNYETILED